MSRHAAYRCVFARLIIPFLFAAPAALSAQSSQTPDGPALYAALARFELNGGSARAQNVVLKRDRVQITFDGTFYFESPVDGRICGAVFLGSGKVHADAPESVFERDNLKRMLHADAMDSDFKSAVLRFSDDTIDALGLIAAPGGSPPDDARKLASDLSPHILRESGANVAACLAVSILNRESPGFFLAEFDKGARGRFALLLDYQGRLPSAHFGLDGGEKGLFFAEDTVTGFPDVWMAFFSLADYSRDLAEYSDAHALVKILSYNMDIDLRDWKGWLVSRIFRRYDSARSI